ncbi:hypothetical protein DEU56DRAFT_914870 [Suillus clintonianus]|uniref:uncharacterized protein n=1 Tax=Suillus clintonianus TaxID=1904413 RepID=UPI001B872DA4|nr:uncharacterized protein DEU56DRAFT_914870 [Suillus clintonianus]KAG2130240.1 hypothetical protein DEU56DRAFT_914870 [Suillus clintonianus]
MSLLLDGFASIDYEDAVSIRTPMKFMVPLSSGPLSIRTSMKFMVPLLSGPLKWRSHGRRFIKTLSLNLYHYNHLNIAPRRRGQKSQVATTPTPAAVPLLIPTAAAPIAAAPITAAVALNATALQHPHRQRQMPMRFRDNNPAQTGTNHTADDGEYIEIGHVSGDEEDDLPAPGVRAPPVLGPLQTATSTVYSTQNDPLATGIQGTQPKSTADVCDFFRLDPATNRKICQVCEDLQKVDDSHRITTYKHMTSTSAHRNHAFFSHTDLYLQEAERLRWPILVKSLKLRLNEG